MKKIAIIILILLFAGTASSVQMHPVLDNRVDPEDSPTFVDLTLTGGNIMSASSLNLKPSDDNDDYFQFTSESNIPTIAAVGGDVIRINDNLDIVPAGGWIKLRNNSQAMTIAASPTMSSSDDYVWPTTDAASDRQPIVSNASAVLRFGDTYYSQAEISSTTPGSAGCSLIGMDSLGGATFTTLCDFHTNNAAAGVINPRTNIISDGGGETIDTLGFTGWLRTTDSHIGKIVNFDLAATASTAIPTDTTRYIGVEYNAGTPQLVLKASDTWNDHDEFPLGVVVNESGTLHIFNNPKHTANFADHAQHRFYQTEPLARDERAGGILLDETGTRNVTVTAGVLIDRVNEFIIAAIDTSGADTFDSYVGATLDAAGESQWDNANYDNGGVKTAMIVNRYGTKWFYIESDGDLVMVYGSSNTPTQAQAVNEPIPSTIPDRLTVHGRLIGRYVFQNGAASAALIQTIPGTVFSAAGVTSHLNLTDIGTNTHAEIDTHIVGDGSDHSFIDQDITSGSSPILDGTNFTGIPNGALDETYINADGLVKMAADLDIDFFDIVEPGEMDGSVSKDPVDVLNNKQAYWRFEDDNFDISLADSSGNSHDIQLDSGVEGLCNRGRGIGLDPLAGLAEYSVDDAWKGVTGTVARSLSFWFKTTNTTTTSFITSWGDVGGAGQNWQVAWVGSTLKVGVFTGAGNKQSDAIATGANGEWHHIAITMADSADMDEIIIYVDGSVSAGSGTAVAVNTGAVDDVEVGHGASGGNFDGCIDELFISSDVLIQSEIDNIVAGQGTKFIGGSDDSQTDWTKAHTSLVTSKPGTFGTLTVHSGSITDSSGAISFGNENITTTGILNFDSVEIRMENLPGVDPIDDGRLWNDNGNLAISEG